MLPFTTRGIKSKSTAFKAIKLCYLFLYLGSIAFFYLIAEAYWKADQTFPELYFLSWAIFTVVVFFILKDIYHNYNFFQKTNAIEGVKLIEEAHFLCAQPNVCPRCGGWYFGLTFSAAVLLSLNVLLIEVLRGLNINGFFLIIFGSVIFLIATPIHGSLNFLKKSKWYKRFYFSTTIRLFLGLLSGVSVSLIVIGLILMAKV